LDTRANLSIARLEARMPMKRPASLAARSKTALATKMVGIEMIES
jgi:hypothetical protein